MVSQRIIFAHMSTTLLFVNVKQGKILNSLIWQYLPLTKRSVLYLPIWNPIINAISPIMVHLNSHHAARNGNVITRIMVSPHINQFLLGV